MRRLLSCLAIVALAWRGAQIEGNECEYPCECFEGFYIGITPGAIGYLTSLRDCNRNIIIGSANESTVSGTIGGQIGYDLQCGRALFGLVADGNWTHAETKAPFLQEVPSSLVDITFKTTLDWFVTLRARLGVTIDRTLVYITGGAAACGIHARIDAFNDGTLNNFNSPFDVHQGFDRTIWGVTGGGGSEFLFCNNWSVGVEILYTIFAKTQVTATDPDFLAIFNRKSPFEYTNQTLIGRLSLNYRFR